MKNIILLVQSEEQAKQLAAAGKVIGRLGAQNLWVLYSPILTVDESKVGPTLRKDIVDLEKAEKQAASVGDYESAKKYRNDREAKMLELSTEVRNAWKNVSPDDRKKRVGTFLEPFLRAANPKNQQMPGWKIQMLPEHQEPQFWIQTLNELKGIWHPEMKAGEFVVTWPDQLVQMLHSLENDGLGFVAIPPTVKELQAIATPTRTATATKPVTPKTAVAAVFATEEDRLNALPYFTLKSEATKHGVTDISGKKKPEIVAAILAAQNAKAA